MSKLFKNTDVLSGLLVLAIAIFFLIGGRNYEIGTLNAMGPGLVPLVMAGVLATLGIVLLAQGIRTHAPSKLVTGNWAIVPMILVLGAIGLFALTLRHIGYVAACAMVVVICGLAAPDRRMRETIIEAVLLAVVSALVFVEAIGMPMPLFPWSN
jgi:hypothetical protein